MLDFNNKKNNIIITICFILAITFIVYANKIDTSVGYNSYSIVVSDASGIKVGQDVTINGYKVGYVSKIYMDKKYGLEIIVNIDKKVMLTTDAMVKITNSSIISSRKNVDILNGIDSEYLENKGTIYNSSVGLSLDQILELVGHYINS
jgi:ABC-type transporter Mla subunit MlaD